MGDIRLVVVGAGQLTRDLLRHGLASCDARLRCVCDFGCEPAVVEQCRALAPDLVVFALYGDSVREVAALDELAAESGWALLVVAGDRPDQALQRLVARRRSGVFSRRSSLEALAHAAHLVALGGSYFDAALHELLVRRGEPEPLALSQRERHVLQLVAEGYSTKEVADILQLSIKTVDNYRTSLMQKLGVHDVVRLTHQAIRMGLVRID